MTDGERLLQAILRDPGDTALRLVYADALEESGDEERAEFIRAQIEVSRTLCHLGAQPGDGCNCSDCHHCMTERRATLLEYCPDRSNIGSWSSEFHRRFHDMPFPSADADDGPWWQARRGFVESVRCSVAEWAEYGKRICDRHPVRTLVLHDFAPWMNPSGGFFMVRVLNGRLMQDCRYRMDPCWIPDKWGRRLLAGTRLYRNRALRDRRYPTETEARLDAEAAALSWAKERRGRKPFPGSRA